MKGSAFVGRINPRYRDNQIICRFDPLDRTVPLSGIFAISNNVFVQIKMLVGTVPVYIGFIGKIFSDLFFVLS